VVYRDYNEVKLAVITAIMILISKAKGSCVTFTSKKLAVIAGLPTQPILLTVIRDVLENLRSEGLIKRYKRTSHGVKYMVTKDSPLWIYAVKGDDERLKTPYLAPIIDEIRARVS